MTTATARTHRFDATATRARPKRNPPGPRGVPFLGNVGDVVRNPLELLLERRRDYGDVVRTTIGSHEFILVASADGIQRVLQMNSKNYVKNKFYNIVKPVLGRGLLNSEGKFWRKQRRIAQPSFHKQRLEVFAQTMDRAIDDKLDSWTHRREPFNVHRDMNELALRIVGETLFSTDMGTEVEKIGRTLENAMKLYELLFPLLMVAPDWMSPETWPIPGARKIKSTLDDIIYGFVRRRRRAKGSYSDLLDMYMQAVDEDGSPLTDQQVRDEMMTLVLAGHETTAVAMSWAFYMLAKHPEVQDRIRAEGAAVLGDGPLTLANIGRLEYTTRVVQETLRLYPPAWGFGRQAVADDEIGGYHINAGANVQVLPWVLHRHPDYWDNPDKFDPDRFTSERSAGRHKFSYIPFGGGPRLCIGSRFSLIEAALMLAKTTQRYRVGVAPGARIAPKPSLSLRPKNGIPLSFTLLSSSR